MVAPEEPARGEFRASQPEGLSEHGSLSGVSTLGLAGDSRCATWGPPKAAQARLGQGIQPPAVALVDPLLPDASGVEIIQALKTLAPSCRIIAMTDDDTSQDERDALLAGAADVLVKPLHLDRTAAQVRALTGCD